MQNVVTNASVKSPIEPNTLHFVSDNELLLRTKELARSETAFTIVTIQHLDEIERRGLYDKRGYPSLFEYAVRELHYSKGGTWRRIMVMKLCRTVPGIADRLRSGELNLTTASQLQNAIEKRARKAARERANESVSVPAAGAVRGAAGEPIPGEVQPARTRAAGVEAAASGAVWADVGEAATQAAAGESAAGESAAGESAAGESAAGESAAGESAAGESAAGESAAGESAAGESAAGESAAGESAAGESAAGESAAGESAAGESAAGESAAGESAAGESAAGESAAGESAAGESAAGESAAGESAAGESAAGESAAGESAAGESAAAVPLPAGGAAAGVTPAAARLAPAQAEAVGVGPAAAAPAEPVTWPSDTAAARAAENAAVAAPPAPASAAAAPTAGAARESAALPPVAAPPPAWTLDQTVELVNLVANKSARETEKLLAELEPELALPRERQRALGGGRYEVRVILDQGSVDTIAKLKGLLSHVNPGFTTGQLLAYLLQQAERKYDPLRERGRAKRGVAAPARYAETCEQHLVVCNERRGTGSALGAGVSKAGSSTCPTGAPGEGEGVPATKAARGSIAAGAVAAGAPAPGSAAGRFPASAPAAASSADARTPGPAATGPSGALAGGSAQNQRAPAVPGRTADRTPHSSPPARLMPAFPSPLPTLPAPATHSPTVRRRSERRRYSATGPIGLRSTPPAWLMLAFPPPLCTPPVPAAHSPAVRRRTSSRHRYPGHRADRTPQHAAGSADAGFSRLRSARSRSQRRTRRQFGAEPARAAGRECSFSGRH